MDSYHRAQTLGAGTCVSIVAVVHSDNVQELATKVFVNKEEEQEERTPNVNIGHYEKYSFFVYSVMKIP